MGFRYLSCQIGIPGSHPNSSQSFKKPWVLPCTSASFFTLRLMVNLKGSSRLRKTCFGHVCWNLKTVGWITCHWSNLSTIIATRPALVWPFIKHCMEENVELRYVREWKFNNVELIEVTSEKIWIIRERLKTAQDWQKSYADTQRRKLEFEVGDMVFLKVAPWKWMIWF